LRHETTIYHIVFTQYHVFLQKKKGTKDDEESDQDKYDRHDYGSNFDLLRLTLPNKLIISVVQCTSLVS